MSIPKEMLKSAVARLDDGDGQAIESAGNSIDVALHARRANLRNGNVSGPTFGKEWPGRRCGARTRQHGACLNPAMPNGRCRMHGGKSTGPKSAEGKFRARYANWQHGDRAQGYVSPKRALAAMLQILMNGSLKR